MKYLFTLAFLSMIASLANATVRIITCQNGAHHFLPVSLQAVSGDTIRWTWVDGHHIAGPIDSSYIPNGAGMWNGLLDANHLTFDYVVTVPGTYNYDCHPAAPHGETGSIVVSAATGLLTTYVGPNKVTAYPNPSSGKISLAFNQAQFSANGRLEVFDGKGAVIYQSAVGGLQGDIDLGNQAKGVYFIRISNGMAVLTEEIEIR